MDILTIINNDTKDISLIALSDYDYNPAASLVRALEEFGILHISGASLHHKLDASAARQAEIDDYTFMVTYAEEGDVILFKWHPDRDEH